MIRRFWTNFFSFLAAGTVLATTSNVLAQADPPVPHELVGVDIVE